jgi:hypothetical protein
MHLYKFERGAEVALTRDRTGNNLPEGGKDWTYLKDISVHADDAARVGASYQAITKGIADHGFYVWAATADAR